jgi:hypothetical protein
MGGLKNNQKTMINKSYSQDNSGVLNPRSHGKYGGMITAKGMQNIDNKEHGRLARLDERENGTQFQEKYEDKVQMDGSTQKELVRTNVPNFSDNLLGGGNTTGSFFVGRAAYDDFSQDYRVGRKEVAAEFSEYELNRYSKPEPRTEFKSKVEEDIYRAKKHLLKTRGSWD